MKGLFFATLTSFALPMLLMAHPAPNQKTPQLEVQVQKLPSDQEGNYYDESTFAPKRPVDRERDYYNSALAPEVRVKAQETSQTPPSTPSASSTPSVTAREVPRLENPPQPNPSGSKNSMDSIDKDVNTNVNQDRNLKREPTDDSQSAPQTSEGASKLITNASQSTQEPNETSDEAIADASGVSSDKTNEANKPATKSVEGKERTLSIIKPDGVNNHHIGEIISRFEKAGLHIADIKMVTLSKEQAEQFYQEHRDRPFYQNLVKSMTSGPVVLMVLEGNQAVSKNRELMGATDPSKAEKGTIRADFAKDVTQNTVHGSDSLESARREILFFFPSDK